MALGTNGIQKTPAAAAGAAPTGPELRDPSWYERLQCNTTWRVLTFIPSLGTTSAACEAARAYRRYQDRSEAENAAVVAGAYSVEAGHAADTAGYEVAIAAAEAQQTEHEVANLRAQQAAALQAALPMILVGGIGTLAFVGYLLWRRRQPYYGMMPRTTMIPPAPAAAPPGFIGDATEWESVQNCCG